MADAGESTDDHRFDALRTAIPAGRPVVYFDYAVYGNVGDLLIHKASDVFLAANDNRIIDAFDLQNHGQALRRVFPRDAVLVFQGGGNMGDLFPRHDRLRLDILAAFPNHRAVIMPQTAYYRDATIRRAALAGYAAHPDLHVMLRDQRSVSDLGPALPGPVTLMPDMAHRLAGDAFIERACAGILPERARLDFMREPWQGDPEQAQSLDVAGIEVWNWPEYLNPKELRWIRRSRRMHRHDARRWHTAWPRRIWRRRRDRILERALAFFAGHHSIHTNRLHGSLMGLLCDREVVMYDTSYGKLSHYYQTWLHDDVRVRFGGALSGARPN